MESMTVLNDDTDTDSDDEILKPKTTNTSRRRGLAARLHKKESSTDFTTKASVYSMKVSKSLDAMCNGNFPLTNIIKRSTTEDIEGDSPVKKSKPVSPPSPVCITAVIDGEDSEVEELDNLLPCTPTNDKNNSIVVNSPSPPPPPPPEGNEQTWEHTKKQKMTRKARKAYNNLTAARHTLIVDEYQTLQTESSEPDLICLEDDEDNSPLTVRIKYGVKVHKFKLKRNEMFEKLRTEMGKREGINPHQLLLIHKDKTVQRTDTPDSLDLHVADILECHVVKESDTSDDHVNEFNCLTIYVQSKNSKQKQEYKIDKFKPIEVLLRKYALQNNEDLSKLRLQFDGDDLDSMHTPEDLDLEDGFCLDIISTS